MNKEKLIFYFWNEENMVFIAVAPENYECKDEITRIPKEWKIITGIEFKDLSDFISYGTAYKEIYFYDILFKGDDIILKLRRVDKSDCLDFVRDISCSIIY
jgi:hypothetical protein